MPRLAERASTRRLPQTARPRRLSNVLVFRKESDGRVFPPAQLAGLSRGLEGADVFIDAPERPGEPRGVLEGVGRVLNVRATPDGLRADVELLTSHPAAAAIAELAEMRGVRTSLDADVESVHRNGRRVVTRVGKVRGLNLVGTPGDGLRESLTESEGARQASSRPATLLEMGQAEQPAAASTADERPKLSDLGRGAIHPSGDATGAQVDLANAVAILREVR